MSKLTEHEYEEYIRLLRAWVEAEKALESPGAADAGATQRVLEAYAAVESFRDRHGLGEAAAVGTAEAEPQAARGH